MEIMTIVQAILTSTSSTEDERRKVEERTIGEQGEQEWEQR